MASATVTYVGQKPIFYATMIGTNIDAGNNDIDLVFNMINFEKGFAIQTGTLTDMTVTILDSLDGSVYVDSTEDYAGTGVSSLASDTVYKVDLKSVVHSIKVRAVRVDGTNAVDIKVFAPNR